MTGPVVTVDELAGPVTDSPVAPSCDVCEHELARHDDISARFCRATQSRAMSRSCICR